jgi:tetratricopeptide (TPR) repeat protein
VRPEVKRTAFAEEAQTTVIAIGGMPGKAYEVQGWEIWVPLRPLYEAGEYAEVADRMRDLADTEPKYGGLLYNLACCESLAGRKTEALEHLRQAIDLSEQMREFAKGDSDLDAIRAEPGFSELVAG